MGDSERRHRRYAPSSLARAFPVLILLGVIGSIPRFYKLAYHYTENGVDEGIQLMASRLMGEGFVLYRDFNTLQAPLFHGVFSLLDGDLLLSRALIAIMSIIGVVLVAYMIHRMEGPMPAFLSGITLAFSSYFIKESRLVSMDMAVTVMLIFSLSALLPGLVNGSPRKGGWFLLSGILFGLACMTKLFAVIPFIFIFLYLLYGSFVRSGSRKGIDHRSMKCILLLIAGLAVSSSIVLLVFGPFRTVEGMLLDNLSSREAQPISYKFELLGDFILAHVLVLPFVFLGAWKRWKEPLIRLSAIWLVPLLVFFIAQPITWNHHLVLLVPPLVIIGGAGLGFALEKVRDLPDNTGSYVVKGREFRPVHVSLIIVLSLVITVPVMVIPTARIYEIQKPVEYTVAEYLEEQTEDEDWIISGDPLIPLLADRKQVPEAVNLAQVSSPKLSAEELMDLSEDYGVKAFVITYWTSSLDDLKVFVEENFTFRRGYDSEGRLYSQEPPKWDYTSFIIYSREVSG